jgi:hypothetical protein
VPRWPPDAFAMAMTVLRRAGAYRMVVEEWPPGDHDDWTRFIRRIGEEWRMAAVGRKPLPIPLTAWWSVLLDSATKPIAGVSNDRPLCEALLQLSAAADEASSGIGIFDPEVTPDRFTERAAELLLGSENDEPSSLCAAINSSRVVVLPKLHTPKIGISTNSLTHNLALCEPGDVMPAWYWLPQPVSVGRCLNLLLLPWPEAVLPRSFRETPGRLMNLPPHYGFFTYDPGETRADAASRGRRARQALVQAERLVGQIDGVIFPELALALGEAGSLCGSLKKLVIGGEGKAVDETRSRPGVNQTAVSVPLGPDLATSWGQVKHHRWKLDSGQIGQYGLGSQLDPVCDMWEYIEMIPRRLRFWSLNGWLTFCVLLCEDLARQEPVAELVRSVGPNLVITLLMDGPQLSNRWSARYATVLADDPGCSVLTLTSIGMAQLCRPPGKAGSRVVALWKDAGNPPIELELPPRASGLVLSLTREYAEEFTADGRSDGGATGYVRLNGVHPVFLPTSTEAGAEKLAPWGARA